MNATKAYEKIESVRQELLKIQEVASLITAEKLGLSGKKERQIKNNQSMKQENPKEDQALRQHWQEIQKNVPPGFSIGGDLIRHLSFNMARDWYDIWSFDIPKELERIKEYRKKLALVEYLETLHPEVSRIAEIVLSGDIDAALKTTFSSLDTKIRSFLKLKPSESTVPALGRAFKNKVLVASQPENNESARNFLQGVIGYYRSNLVHNPLPTHRNSIEASLSLFGLAHEAFRLFEMCSKHKASSQ